MQMKRWLVTVHYHSELGDMDVDFKVEDISDVPLLLSQGPDNRSVKLVKIEPLVEAMTIEATVAEKKGVKANEQ